MTKAHYFYFRESLTELERKVEDHQKDFETLLADTFSESEIAAHEATLDEIGAVFVQPIISELTFEDFYPNEREAVKQKAFFESCRSSICLENIPDFSRNPFQITYLIEMLRSYEEVLVDRGGVNELMFKREYIDELKKFKNIFSLLPEKEIKPRETKISAPVEPIDFLILDVYKELDRLEEGVVQKSLENMPEKLVKTYLAIKDVRDDASSLLGRSGLNGKDFGDNLERLKFHLRKI